MTAARLSIEDLRHCYGAGTPTLAGVSIDVEPGSLTCVLGPSGSGKTTLLRAVAGHLQPDAGEVRLDGRSI
ncbi:MAG: ATP-binding cassette domain-containing protein, partial [Polyangia bacterium]